MKRFLTVVLLASLGFLPFRVSADEGIPILMYHHFTEGEDVNSVTVSKEAFEAQMNYLYENGYEAISFKRLEDYIDGKLENNGKMVVITMDDGYRSNYTIAYPILKKYGLKATQFTIVSGIEGLTDNIFRHGRFKGGHSSIEEMNEMKDIFEFQSHTYDRHLLVEDKSVLAYDFIEGIRKDLSQADEILTREGFFQYVFSYPFGQHSASIKQVLEELEIPMAVVIGEERVKVGANKLELPRFNVSGTMSLEEFKALVTPKAEEKMALEPSVQGEASGKKLDLRALAKKYLKQFLERKN